MRRCSSGCRQRSPARPFLAAALELAGKQAELTPPRSSEKDRWLAEFEQNKAASKPIGFYDWTPELKQVWRFYRFLQHEFGRMTDELAVPRDVAAVLKDDAEAARAVSRDQRLLRPADEPVDLPAGRCADRHAEGPARTGQAARRAARVGGRLPALDQPRNGAVRAACFPMGVPADVNLMAELIRRIRSGEVDLKPGESDGWYQYQVYALETLLLPAKGQEKDKLLLTAEYKKRLVEAFKALVTKRRETHVRQLARSAKSTAATPLGERREVRPRLRIEPCATFYLRTARAYAFLQNFLRATAGQERLAELHGLGRAASGSRRWTRNWTPSRQRFYGFYLHRLRRHRHEAAIARRRAGGPAGRRDRRR